MDIESIREYALAKPGTTEGFPFGEDVLVLKVMGKMFLLIGLENIPPTVNLKCDPERALDLRETFEGVIPGYHMNKKHWNTVSTESDVEPELFMELIDHSYHLVTASLKRKDRDALKALAEPSQNDA